MSVSFEEELEFCTRVKELSEDFLAKVNDILDEYQMRRADKAIRLTRSAANPLYLLLVFLNNEQSRVALDIAMSVLIKAKTVTDSEASAILVREYPDELDAVMEIVNEYRKNQDNST